MSKSEAGKGDDNRSNSKAYKNNFDKIDRSEKPKAINPNIPQFKCGGVIDPKDQFKGMKPVLDSSEAYIDGRWVKSKHSKRVQALNSMI